MAWGGGSTNNVEQWVKRLRDNDPSFTSLHILSFRRVTPAELGQVFAALQHNSHLQELYASGHALDRASASALAEALKHNQTLQRLNIGHDHFGVDRALVERFCQGLALNRGLKKLDLENKGFGADAEGDHTTTTTTTTTTIAILAKALESEDCHLEELVLARNKLTDADVTTLCRSLRKNGRLQKLDLCLNSFGRDGTEAVARLLLGHHHHGDDTEEEDGENKSRLIEIDLSDNEISEEGGCALGHALATNKVLQRLRLSSTMDPPLPVEEGEEDESEVVPKDRTLEELNQPLSDHEVEELKTDGDAVLAALAASLRVNDTLQELWMDYCNLTPVGVVPLAEALRVNRSLKTLRLRNNRVGNRGARALGAALTRVSHQQQQNEEDVSCGLTSIDLSVNKIGQLGWQGLAGVGSPLESCALFGNKIKTLHEALESSSSSFQQQQQQQQLHQQGSATEVNGLANGSRSKLATTSGGGDSSMVLGHLLHLDLGCNEISREAFTSLGASLIKGMLPSLTRLEIAGNGDRSEVEHEREQHVEQQLQMQHSNGGGDSHHDDDKAFPETVREEEQAWARVVERIREARPELEIHWKVSNGQAGGREF
ncbi:hypothetical protein DFQ26_005618 [Actinomortierella ambigua]|nr:hypothetical protein DFQ26_005618 [Actinomortierella ambigua]